jgi:hypothetical protein
MINLNLYNTPREIYDVYYETHLKKCNIWKELYEVINISFLEKWKKSTLNFINDICPSIKYKITSERRDKNDSIIKKKEFAIRNYLLEKPALLEYFFQEIMICLAEVRLFRKGIGAKPDILLGQQSHRGDPRHYLYIELKSPTIFTDMRAEQQRVFREARDFRNTNFAKKINTEGIEVFWCENMLISGSQLNCGFKTAIPFSNFKEKIVKKNQNDISDKESSISDKVLGFKKARQIRHSYDDLLRPIMRDIIAMGPRNFDKWIETKSNWIKSTTNKFTERYKEIVKFNPYIDLQKE